MSVDLHNRKGGYFKMGNWGWRQLLMLAHYHGDWEPQGTTIEGDERWDGSYFSNDGQLVGEEDARNLADALERAAPKLGPTEVRPIPPEYVEEEDPAGYCLKAMGGWQESVAELAEFARQGDFVIH